MLRFREGVLVMMMKVLLSVFFAFGLYGLAHAKVDEGINFEQTISVRGVGEVEVVPDQVSISFSLSFLSDKVIEAKLEVDNKAELLIKKIKQFDIEDQNIHAEDVRVHPKYEYDRKVQKNLFKGYDVSRHFVIVVKKLDIYPKLIDSIMEVGVNHFGGVVFDSSKRDSYLVLAMEKAIGHSIEKANKMCRAYGVKRGRVLEIVEGGVQQNARPMLRGGVAEMSLSESGKVFKPGSIKIKAEVKAIFSMSSMGVKE